MVGTILGSSTIAIYLAIKVMHRKKKLAWTDIPLVKYM
jgi:hypothetical protein